MATDTAQEESRSWGRFIPTDHQTRMNIFGITFIVPSILFLILLAGVPVAFAIQISLHDVTLFSQDGAFVGLQNYIALYQNNAFFEAIWTDLVFTVGSVGFQVIAGLTMALALNRSFRGVSLARTLALFPYLVPTIAVALMWKWMLSPVYGVLNAYAIKFGIISESISFFGEPSLAMPMVILASSWKFTSFTVIIFLARLQSIDERMYEQAKISGASVYQMFRGITLPSLRSAILLVVLLRGMFMFNKFDVVWLLTNGGPLGATETLPVYIYRLTFFNYELALGSAAAMNLFLILAVVAVVYFWYFQPSKEIET